MTDDSDPGDPYLRALLAIGAELSQIRIELQRHNGTLDEDGDSTSGPADPPLVCRCGATFATADNARRHAREEHNAPSGAEMDVITER